MSIRIILLCAICLPGNCLPVRAQLAAPPATAEQTAHSAKILVLRLKHLSANEVLSVARPLLGLNDGLNTSDDLSISTNTSGNTIYVTGTSNDKLQKLRDITALIDVRPSDESGPAAAGGADIIKLQTEFLKDNKGLISSFAESSGVSFALNEELGLLMLKGKKEQVQKSQQFIEVLKEIVLKAKLETAVRPTSIAIRVIWLTNAQMPPEMAIENDPKLQLIIDRLAKQGVKNLAIGMQLMSRCDPSSGTPGKCKVSGTIDLKDSSQELFVESNFNQVQSTKVFNGHIEIRATRTPLAGAVSTSSVQVDVNAEPEKYYVLSSSPIGNHHSVFVVQLLDDF